MTGENAYRGGRVEPHEPLEDSKPRRLRYTCFATGCPMPGTLFPDHAKSGVCAWHYAVQPTDIPKVTTQLQAWECVAREIQTARRLLTGPAAADPAAQEAEFAMAWNRLRPLLSAGWETELVPGRACTSKGVDTGNRQSYGDWAKHLERFLGARVAEVLSTRRDVQRPLRADLQPVDQEAAPW